MCVCVCYYLICFFSFWAQPKENICIKFKSFFVFKSWTRFFLPSLHANDVRVKS